MRTWLRRTNTYCDAHLLRYFVRMVIFSRNEDEGTHLERCTVCNAVAIGWDYGNTVCALCGMTLVEPPFAGSDYLEMIMKARPRKGRRSQ